MKTAWRVRMSKQIIICSLIRIVMAAPSISFPINAQIPPVAHVQEEFEFIFSPSTFTAVIPPIQYTLSSAPSWLQLDGGQRRLYGKPTEAGLIDFKINAMDGSGAIEHEATLVVTREPLSKAQTNIPKILSSIGPTDGKDGFVLPPNAPFDLTFPNDIFPQSNIKTFEAVSADNTPLPSWITFDRNTRKFIGIAPSLASQTVPPLTFRIKIVGSEAPGFSDASIPFNIVIATHILHFAEPYVKINATVGESFIHTLSRDSLLLDGKTITPEKLARVSTNATGWIKFDSSSATFSGTPPKGVKSTKVVVTARDTDGNEAEKAIEVDISPSLFTTKIPDFTARRGEIFEYRLNRTTFSGSDVKVSVKISNSDDWISFNAKELEFEGRVPKNAADRISINVTATLGDNTEEERFSMLVEDQVKPSSTSNPNPSQTADSEKAEVSTAAVRKRNSKKVLTICLATILPLLLILGLLYMWFCVKKNRSPSRPVSPASDVVISRPVQPMDEDWSLAAENYTRDGSIRRFSAFVFKSPQLPTQTSIDSNLVSPVSSSENHRGDSPTITVTAPPVLDPVYRVPVSTSSVIYSPKNRVLSPQQSVWIVPQNPIIPQQYPTVRSVQPPSRPTTPQEPTIPPKSPKRQQSQRSVSENPPTRHSIQPRKERTSRRYSSPSGQPRGHRLSSVDHGKPDVGGPPGYGTPKRSWKRTLSSTNGMGGRESDNTLDSVSTGMLFGQPSVRLVEGSEAGDLAIEDNSKNSSYTSRMSTLPSISNHTHWRRNSSMPSLPVTPTLPSQLGYQDSLIDEVMSALSTKDHSRQPSSASLTMTSLGSPSTPPHGRYKPHRIPEQPYSRSPSLRSLHTPTPKPKRPHSPSMPSTPEHRKRRGSCGSSSTDASFMQVTDGSGQKIWYPKKSSAGSPSSGGSGRTGFTRGTGSVPYEPYECGVALASSVVDGPNASSPYDDISSEDLERQVQAQEEGQRRQRAKLVEFTRKRPVSDLGQHRSGNRDSSYSADVSSYL